MKRLFILLCLLVPMFAMADVRPRMHKNKWGYWNSNTGKYAIRPRFDSAHPFVGDYAFVCKKGFWGIIDKNGKFVVEPKMFTYASEPYGDLTIVELSNQYGLVKGRETALAFQFDKIEPLKTGCFRLKIANRIGLADANGKIIIPVEYKEVAIYGDKYKLKVANRYGLAEADGQIIIPVEYDNVSTYGNGYKLKINGRVGFANTNGKVIISTEYNDVSIHDKGYKLTSNGRVGLADASGKIILPAEFDKFSVYNNGYQLVANGRVGYADANGKIIIPAKYEAVTAYDKGFKIKANGRIGFADANGTIIIPAEYDDIATYNNGYWISINGCIGLADTNGKVIMPAEYEDISTYDNGYKLKANGSIGLADANGKIIIPLSKCEDIKKITDNQYLLLSDTPGLIDTEGNINNNLILYTTSDGNTIPSPLGTILNIYSGSIGVIAFKEPITGFDSYEFENCTTLTSITIPDSVTGFDIGVFDGCTSLPVIEGLRYAGTYLVEAVDKTRTSYTIIPGTRFIKDRVFDGCKSMTSITIPKSLESSGEWSFGKAPLKHVYISDLSAWCKISYWSTSPYNGAMSNPCCNGANLYLNGELLEELVIPSDIKEINEHAFVGCSSLKNIVFPEGITGIQIKAFMNCDNLTNITIPDSVKEVGANAFRSCDNLKSVTIGSGVTTLWAGAFIGCKNLHSIYCKATTPPTINLDWAGAWNRPHPLEGHASGRKIYVPRNSVEAYKQAEYWSDYADDIVGYDF